MKFHNNIIIMKANPLWYFIITYNRRQSMANVQICQVGGYQKHLMEVLAKYVAFVEIIHL